MVLQSPIESAIRTVMSKRAQWFLQGIDIFRNYDKAPLIKCPALLMHGTADQVVPYHCGKAIHELLVNAEPIVPFERRGHNDMPEPDTMRKVKVFLDSLSRR
ncbi:unnamed protein product [Prorocentrum cordatum]|uniref:Serine aminopeptidase S33 domain-containing protein n=1 Tax=Prorocentrum cordatum TaxID=2364126 RepID=A0ABN9WQ14_9DINO|nr:unnamed protein product [Polarella glacialis]